jgi:hypothetical protein
MSDAAASVAGAAVGGSGRAPNAAQQAQTVINEARKQAGVSSQPTLGVNIKKSRFPKIPKAHVMAGAFAIGAAALTAGLIWSGKRRRERLTMSPMEAGEIDERSQQPKEIKNIYLEPDNSSVDWRMRSFARADSVGSMINSLKDPYRAHPEAIDVRVRKDIVDKDLDTRQFHRGYY